MWTRLENQMEWSAKPFSPFICLYQPKEEPMTKIALTTALAAAVLMPASLLVGRIPAEAQNLKMAQVDIQLGRDRDRDDSYRHRRDRDATVGIGPGGVTVGPRRDCRTVTTTIDRGDGRMVTRKERRCD
jgi:hypothetical protein